MGKQTEQSQGRGQFGKGKDEKRVEVKIAVPASSARELSRAALIAGESRSLFCGKIIRAWLLTHPSKK
jgi:hypothetical protein